MIVKLDNILNVYENYIYKGCCNKKKIYLFEKLKMSNISYIYNVLETGIYFMKKYNVFLIKYPKYRVVMSLKMPDKIINHYITMYALIPKLSKYLDARNIATRKNMGCDYGIKLIKKYIEKNKKYKNFYILKLDIKKYFYNIDHNVLKEKLKDKLDKTEYNLISIIIDSTNNNNLNEIINKLKNNKLKYTNRVKEVSDIPIYKNNKGLPIGNMTSQFLAIYYLYELDHYIVYNLKIKYMIRYMDDYVLIHHNKAYLKECIIVIENILKDKYKLELNNKKTKIYNIKEGFDFLGYKFIVKNNKTICKISIKTFNNLKLKIKHLKNYYNNDEFKYYYNSVNNYYYSFKYSKHLFVKRYINKNFY